MLRKIHNWGLYIDVAGNILVSLVQILKVVCAKHCVRLASLCICVTQ